MNESRNERIYALRAEGRRLREIAAEFGITTSRVYQICIAVAARKLRKDAQKVAPSHEIA